MDLIERYLAAIRRNLPADKATDVTAELREDLLSRIEERESGLGRSLEKGELSTLIKESGHPLVVASRYKPRQTLIGPETYPFFIFTLKLVLLIVAVIIIIVTGLTLAFGDSSGGFRRLIQIVFGLSIAFAASSFFLSFFSFGGGALV